MTAATEPPASYLKIGKIHYKHTHAYNFCTKLNPDKSKDQVERTAIILVLGLISQLLSFWLFGEINALQQLQIRLLVNT